MAPLPPAPPDMLSSGALVAMQPARGRQLQATVGSPAGLKQALDDGVGHLVLEEGVSDLTPGMAARHRCPRGVSTPTAHETSGHTRIYAHAHVVRSLVQTVRRGVAPLSALYTRVE